MCLVVFVSPCMSSCVVQDDYIDCFGDPALTGKVGTDIEDNKCSWLVVQALSRASDEQRSLLEVRPIIVLAVIRDVMQLASVRFGLYGTNLYHFGFGRRCVA